jgi:tRNA threonylcarbamoyl adenosine modification protein YjeE
MPMGETAVKPLDELAVNLPDEAATLALGERLAAYLTVGDVVALRGDLGAGKTTLARGLITALARRAGLEAEEVPSPSFAIAQLYELGGVVLWHFDLYRIERAAELDELGFSEARGILLVEWPERAGSALPEQRLDIRLEWVGEGRRAFLAGHLQSGHVLAIRELS